MPSPSVLVLVLTYNAGPPLEACLTSLLRTTYPNARIVVLDNGSTDGSDRIPDRLGIPVHRFGENLLYCGSVPLIRLKVRLNLEGIFGKMLGRPLAPYVLEGLRDFRQGVAGIKKFSSAS